MQQEVFHKIVEMGTVFKAYLKFCTESRREVSMELKNKGIKTLERKQDHYTKQPENTNKKVQLN